MSDKPAWISAASFERPLARPKSAWTTHGPFALWLIEALRPRTLVELGTFSGYSYLCFCQKIAALGLATRCAAVDTWQGDEHAGFYGDAIHQELAAYHDPKYGAFSRLVRSTFDEAAAQFEDGSIDLLHVDGRHRYEDVRHDFEAWQGKLSSRAIVLFHDTQVQGRGFGVWRLWEEISHGRPSFEFTHGYGLGVLGFGDAPEVAAMPLFGQTMPLEEKLRIRNAYERLGVLVESDTALKRNDPCPCRSGQKYKHCHGALV